MNSETLATESSDSLNRFTDFSKLPTELRWTIWRMAICSDPTPRIHYYSLFNDDIEGHRQTFLRSMLTDKPTMAEEPRVRRDGEKLPLSPYPMLRTKPQKSQPWTKANRLLYYWDAGLRTACWESRAVLLHHRGKTKRRRVHTGGAECPTHKDVVATCNRDQRTCIDICRRDIVCLRFAPEDLRICATMRWDVLFPRLPFFCLPKYSGINIAFEFDDSWNDGLGHSQSSLLEHLYEPSIRGLVLRACWAWGSASIPRSTRIWLIDRGGRLPANYDVRKGLDYRYHLDDLFGKERIPYQHTKDDTIFIDGKTKYVECYMWDYPRQYYGYNVCRFDVPVSRFIWKLDTFCRPGHQLYIERHKQLFRVLRPLPGTDGTG